MSSKEVTVKIRKTKIVCTLGPATDKEGVLEQLIVEGMDVARFNFSHGEHAEQKKRYEQLKALREKLDRPVAALLDTKGPEIRIRDFKEGKVALKKGQTFCLMAKECEGDETQVAISYPELVHDVKKGARILLDDGLIEMRVDEVTEDSICCTVLNDGVVSNRKGVNVPDVDLSMPYISEKDRADIEFAIDEGFDFIAASFVRSADDILQIRKIFDEKGCDTIHIIAKIENMQGVNNIDEIIRVTDGIMVARGDMGVEIPFEEVPLIQKSIIRKVNNAGKVVITATQMLDSMIKNPRPTRAETTDVANAIFDGTGAIMLSGETAAGAYPVEAVKTMVKIALATEESIDYASRFKKRGTIENPDITSAISHATCMTAMDLGAKAIVTVTQSGQTARMISKYRPSSPIICFAVTEKVCRQLNLGWGIRPFLLEAHHSVDDLFDAAVDVAMKKGIVESGDVVVITAGVPLGVSGTTNLIKVHVAGHILMTGKGLGNKSVTGHLCVAGTVEEMEKNFHPGDILVTKETTNEMMPYLKQAGGMVVEAFGSHSHAAIVGLSLDIPVLTGATSATSILKSGAYVNLDSKKGVVTVEQR
ncbi:pyruvate kinase [Lachnospiraceae bacterium XBB1006]|nr:pyruvate kinase [Lachnospiraceae bacterium XBB1006]